jgi:hypothetical protein
MVKIRLRLKTIQWTIAFCAVVMFLGLESYRLISLAGEYRKKAQLYATLEGIQLQIKAQSSLSENSPWPFHQSEIRREFHEYVENAVLQAEYFKSMKEKYSRATARPWERVLPDPPQPYDIMDEPLERRLQSPF